jgi:L-alanine-DL-glutamate epimerase-like enolase superfamily enzyme
MKPTDIRLCDVACELEDVPFRAPLKFGGRVVDRSRNINVAVTVETRDGRRATGCGSMPQGNVWAWPSATLEPERTAEAVVRVAAKLCRAAGEHRASGHPLDIVTDLEHGYRGVADDVTSAMGVERMPDLAMLVAASPLDAAIHDAFGRALGLNSYRCYGPEFVSRDLSAYLGDGFRGEYLDRHVSADPKPVMPLYHLVGALDPLTAADVKAPIGDGLPETLADWCRREGLTHLKIKLAGDDLAWDVARVAAVDAVASGFDRPWRYSLDFNEKCKDVGYVLEFLAKVRETRPTAMERVQYIEQPTARDLRSNPANTMHAAAKVRPVVIDESLTDLATMKLAVEMGYSGVALKACKGHTQALLMGAYAQHHGLFLCVQDLTCPGASFLHSASIAARLPAVAAIEGNGRQYCPAGNRGWSARFPGLFDIRDGTVGTGDLTGPGLGF